MKIPTSSFLTDFGLVGASVFILVCLAQPKSETWVATVRLADGTMASIEIDEQYRHQGNDESTIRRSILNELVPLENKKRGLARWQSETSMFYAQADSQRLASVAPDESEVPDKVFQTASYQAESTPESLVVGSSKNLSLIHI